MVTSAPSLLVMRILMFACLTVAVAAAWMNLQ